MLPLDPHIELVNIKFDKYVFIDDTEKQLMKKDTVLFKNYKNKYCHIEHVEN